MNSSAPWLIVGLGNPGAQYADTRHNVGHMTVQLLAERAGNTMTSHRASSTHTADIRLGTLPGGIPGPRVTLAISDSYMNTSGGPISRLMKYLNIGPEQLLVIHDDLDLPAHELRLKKGGGEGGHNGLKSLTQHLGTRDYFRLRIGIGRPPGRQDPAAYVLARLNVRDRAEMNVTIEQAADVVQDMVLHGFVETQQKLHTARS
ncbi:aminoacyl-tRNA hydrolase [Schaalia sp. lx-260]|uniref:aminoacyl-tRNA hydrolase n=1 Tax=Schaalia sp. lx-260 TaxID=2899082 RepID=UPI001E505181|nr:aminoacyl-tRNA hydrolase [Schaalia sp. lx-260]MCD4549774.1 aminoacyl-tRNA hydrolase [Schaalia sp. lx-260]